MASRRRFCGDAASGWRDGGVVFRPANITVGPKGTFGWW